MFYTRNYYGIIIVWWPYNNIINFSSGKLLAVSYQCPLLLWLVGTCWIHQHTPPWPHDQGGQRKLSIGVPFSTSLLLLEAALCGAIYIEGRKLMYTLHTCIKYYAPKGWGPWEFLCKLCFPPQACRILCIIYLPQQHLYSDLKFTAVHYSCTCM